MMKPAGRTAQPVMNMVTLPLYVLFDRRSGLRRYATKVSLINDSVKAKF